MNEPKTSFLGMQSQRSTLVRTRVLLFVLVFLSLYIFPLNAQFSQHRPDGAVNDWRSSAEFSFDEISSSSLNLSLEQLGFWGLGACQGTALMGNYLLTSNGATLLWLDVANPMHPTVVWDTVLVGRSGKKIIQDSIGYTLLNRWELVILDFRNPNQPSIMSRFQLPPDLYVDFVVQGTLVFVQRSFGTSSCIDVSDLTSPYVRSSIPVYSEFGMMTISGHNLYIASEGCCPVSHVDVSNPDSVRVTSLNELPSIVSSLYARDTLMFLGTTRFRIYSIAVPATPVLLSNLQLGLGTVVTLALHGDTAYVGTDNGNIVSIDISNRTNPVVIGTYTYPPPSTTKDIYAWSMTASDTILYASFGYGLRALSTANPTSMKELSFFPTGFDNRKVIVRGGLAYVTSGYGGLWVADVSDPAQPRTVGHFPTAGYAYDLVIDSNLAYVSINDPRYYGYDESINELCVLDIARPDSIQLLDSYPTSNPFEISKSGSLLFLTHSNYIAPAPDTTLTVLDVRDPTNVVPLGRVIAGVVVREITSRDSVAFLATDDGLKIFDCRNPVSPQLIVSVPLSLVHGVCIEGDYAYVDRSDSAFVVDITNLASPVIIGRVRHLSPAYSGPTQSIAIQGRLFWSNMGEFGVIDVSNPSSPQILLETPHSSQGGLAIVGDKLYLTNLAGLGIYRSPVGPTSVREYQRLAPSEIKLLPNYPNPFNPSTNFKFTIVNRELTILKVYDLLGREVATLVNEVKEPGTYEVTWDANGMASGVYVCRLTSSGLVQTGKMLLLK